MKFLLLLFVLNPISDDSYAHFFNDEVCYLDESEMQRLESTAALLKANTGINIVYVCHKRKYSDGAAPNGRLVIYLAEDPKKREISSRQRRLMLKQDYLDQLSIQFLQQGSRGDELIDMVSLLCKDIENLWKANEELKKRHEEDEEEMSPQFWFVIKVYAVLIVMYGIWVFAKWKNKASNMAEYWEHYGYSRFPIWLQYSLWIAVFAGYCLILNAFVYFYSEIFILLIPLGFLMRPSVMLVSGLISYGIDWKTQIAINDEPSSVSLGQKRFLFSPKSKTEELILLDLLELIITENVVITPQPKDARYGSNKYYKFLTARYDGDWTKVSSFQHEMLVRLKQGENLTVLDKLMAEIITEIGSFKAIRKDFFMKDLVRLGYISKKSWVLNRFDLSDDGKQYQDKLSTYVKKMDSLLRSIMEGEASVGQLRKEVLVANGYERKVERLYDHLVTHGGYGESTATELGPILDQTFSFHEFRSAIERQISKIHKSYMVDEGSQKGDY